MTFNHHKWGLTVESFIDDAGLSSMFWPTSTSTDKEGQTFVATMESKEYPFFGTQFHPEKVLGVYNVESVNHSWTSVQYNRYFADRFVELARQNSNSCGDFEYC